MPAKFDPKIHHRRSIRLPGYDYAQAGAYFVTMVTWQRDNLFGEIVNEEMILNDFGKIADECWRAIPEHFPCVELGVHQVMPNHVHGIIAIVEGRGAIYRAPTMEQYGKPTVGSIPTIVRTYKAAVTRQIGRQFNAAGIWQRNYYEHIIRNEREMDISGDTLKPILRHGMKMTKTQPRNNPSGLIRVQNKRREFLWVHERFVSEY